MNKKVIAQIAGVALFIFGLQGGIRMLSTNLEPGLLAAVLPGGPDVEIGVYVAIATAGGYLAAWGSRKSK